MAERVRFFFFLAFLNQISCSSNSVSNTSQLAGKSTAQSRKENFPAGKILDKISCERNPAESFALYLPARYDTSKKFPVIFFFDPHGNGILSVSKYHLLAEEFSIALAGSNDSKNGMT